MLEEIENKEITGDLRWPTLEKSVGSLKAKTEIKLLLSLRWLW